MVATGYSRGAGALRLYLVHSGLKLVMGHNQQGRQIKLTIIFHNKPSSETTHQQECNTSECNTSAKLTFLLITWQFNPELQTVFLC
jgi:hypothetical protein